MLLFPEDAGPIVLPAIRPEDFFQECHQEVARFLMQSMEDARPADAVTLGHHIRATHIPLDGTFVPRIMDAAPSGANIAAQVDILRELSLKRGIIRAAARFMDEGMNGKPVVEVLADNRVRVDDLEREAAGSSLKTFSAVDIPAMEVPPLVPIVGDNLITEGGFTLVVGKQGLGKTFAVYDLALLLASGRGGEWMGVQVPATPIPVLWLFGEGGRSAVKQRALQLTGGKDLPERLHFFVPDDYALDLCKPSDIAKVRMSIEAMKTRYKASTVFLVIDPLADWAVYDQNSEADRLIRGLRSLQRKLNATLCCIHHPKKPQMGATKGDSNNARGDSRLAGACDSMLMFDPEEDDKVRVTWAKLRNAAHREPLIARLDGGSDGEPGTFRFHILHRLSDKPNTGQTLWTVLEEARVTGDGWMFKRQIEIGTGLSKKTVEKHLQKLTKAGTVECDNLSGGTAARYRLADE